MCFGIREVKPSESVLSVQLESYCKIPNVLSIDELVPYVFVSSSLMFKVINGKL